MFIEPPGPFGVDATGFIEQHLSGVVVVERHIEVDLLATTNHERWALLIYGTPSASAARIMGEVGHIAVIEHSLAPLNVGFEHG